MPLPAGSARDCQAVPVHRWKSRSKSGNTWTSSTSSASGSRGSPWSRPGSYGVRLHQKCLQLAATQQPASVNSVEPPRVSSPFDLFRVFVSLPAASEIFDTILRPQRNTHEQPTTAASASASAATPSAKRQSVQGLMHQR